MPETKSTTSKWVTVAILLTELCERLTFYSLSGNLVLFCTNILQFSNDAAVNISFSFTALVYFIPLGGGYIADLISGRFNAIYGSALIYVLGATSVTLSSGQYDEMFNDRQHNLDISGRRALYILGLLLIAIGSGGIKANVSTFGAQQLDRMGANAVQTFFNWFYWFINLGAAIAYSGVVYIQQEVSFFVGYLIPTFSILLAIVIFMLPRKSYVNETTGANALKDFVQVYAGAIKSYKRRSIKYRRILDYARASNGGEHADYVVDNVLRIQRILPIFACIIMFWTIYFQMQNTFFLQGERLNLNITNSIDKPNVRVPVASLNLFNTIGILLMTPLLDRLIYPALRNYLSYSPSKLQRIGLGMVFAACSIFAAGFLELSRKNDIATTGGWSQDIAGVMRTSSYISIFVQVPQFLLVGM
jgi:solute carrier family 15 (peptide/histidine transporter), member 3/4